MSLVMDRRIARRRRLVLEDDARRRLRWLVAFFWAVTAAGVLLSVARSPILDIDEVRVSGVRNADVESALLAADVGLGVPTLTVDVAAIENALASDPWVARAEVALVWPNTVEVTVLEHQSVGWLQSKNGWMRVSAAGTVIDRGPPPAAAAKITMKTPVAGKIGQVLTAPAAMAAVEFLANLPPDLRRRARIWGDESSLVASVRGHRIELGAVGNMAEKAAVVAGLLERSDLPEDAELSVVAPNRPAILNPQPLVEGSTSAQQGTETSG